MFQHFLALLLFVGRHPFQAALRTRSPCLSLSHAKTALYLPEVQQTKSQPAIFKETAFIRTSSPTLSQPAFVIYLFRGLLLALGACVVSFAGVVWLVVMAFTVAESFLEVSGSQRKNSCSKVLTVSGHSIITMWLPSSMTFRKANSRIWKEEV